MSNFRFIRKNGKVLGPLTTDRIDDLFSSGKLASTDELASSQAGPWQSVATIQERMERKSKKKEAEGAATNSLDRDYMEPPLDAPDAFAGMPDFPDPLHSAPPVSSASASNPTWSQFAAPTQRATPIRQVRDSKQVNDKAKKFSHVGEELDATDPLRWIFPWKWETDKQPYPMLLLYLKFAKATLIWFYSIFLVFGFFTLVGFAVMLVRESSEEDFVLKFFETLIAVPVFTLLWWLTAQLIYVGGMASVDFLRCILALERNTR